MLLKLLVVTGLTILGFVGIVTVANMRWRATLDAREKALIASSTGGRHLDVEALPAPVLRYLQRAGPTGSPDIGIARLRQEGTFLMGEGDDGWRPFEATQVISGTTPGFYWDASIRMAPGILVRVRDSYVRGSAEMVARVLGILPVVNAADGPELRQGALSRYLAEAAWVPTRLRTGPGMIWREVDPNSADATLVDRGTSVTLRFTFDEAGDLVQVHGLRQREVESRYVETPWVGRFRDHAEVAGYRIPLYGEVAWVIDGDERPYWRGRVVEAAFTSRR